MFFLMGISPLLLSAVRQREREEEILANSCKTKWQDFRRFAI
jgi:hypothetical protein